MNVQFILKSTFTYERMGIMVLAAWLKKHGHKVKLLITENLTADEIVGKISDFNPKVLAYSIMTGEHPYYLELNRMLKNEMNVYSVFGGSHPTFVPDLIEQEGVDAICVGEGDISFPKMLAKMERGESFYDVDNFHFKIDGKIIRNEIGSLIENMDDVPFPDREFMYEADPFLATKRIKSTITMRGCPYLCTYCFNHAYNDMTRDKGEIIRSRSVDNVIAEMKQIKERYPLEFIEFLDDTYLIKPKGWLEEFADKFPREVGLPFGCNIRPNYKMDELGRYLKKAGCRSVWMGVECGNNEIADNLLKRHVSNEKIEEVMNTMHKLDIWVFAQNLIGLPVDDPVKVDLETLDFNIKLKPTYAWSSILYPFPSTPIGKVAIDQGLFHGDFEKVNITNKSSTCLNFSDPMVRRKIDNLHKLFGIIVEFPFLRPFTEFLTSLPITKFYTFLFFLLYGYKNTWKKMTWPERFRKTFAYFLFFLKYVPNLEKKKTLEWKVRKTTTYPSSAAAPK